MAKPSFLFQSIRRNNDHETAIRSLFSIPDLSQVILSVAYVRETGVLQLEKWLTKFASITTVFAGIRNGNTSTQGLLALAECGVKIYAVDTGTLTPIFHPKVYLAYSKKTGCSITGSANLTTNGLTFNIEASTMLMLDRLIKQDEAYMADIISGFASLKDNFPEHVIAIKTKQQITKLLEEGRLEDERIVNRQSSTRIKENTERDNLKRMPLLIKKPDFVKKQHVRREVIKRAVVNRFIPSALKLAWISKGLTERDLNIPTGRSTNATGSMLFKKGQFDEIDQRTYFREDVFASLLWQNDHRPNLAHLERAEANFEILIKGINYGVFRLKLTHNSRKDTEAYRQKNAMTQIHWGNVKPIIAQRDLLGRELRLYSRNFRLAIFHD